jgi:hypothetical protein
MKEALALDREIEAAAGLRQRALHRADVPRMGTGHRQRRLVAVQSLHVFGEDQPFAAKAGGGLVGDVLGDDRHLAHQPDWRASEA